MWQISGPPPPGTVGIDYLFTFVAIDQNIQVFQFQESVLYLASTGGPAHALDLFCKKQH